MFANQDALQHGGIQSRLHADGQLSGGAALVKFSVMIMGLQEEICILYTYIYTRIYTDDTTDGFNNLYFSIRPKWMLIRNDIGIFAGVLNPPTSHWHFQKFQ